MMSEPKGRQKSRHTRSTIRDINITVIYPLNSLPPTVISSVACFLSSFFGFSDVWSLGKSFEKWAEPRPSPGPKKGPAWRRRCYYRSLDLIEINSQHSYEYTHLTFISAIPVQELEEVTEAFQLFDTEQKGSIDVKEIKAAFRALGFQVLILVICVFLRALSRLFHLPLCNRKGLRLVAQVLNTDTNNVFVYSLRNAGEEAWRAANDDRYW